MGDERRHRLRAALDLPARLLLGADAPVPARIVDLSSGGFAVKVDEAVPVGTGVSVSIELPEGAPRPVLDVVGVVRRVVPAGQRALLGVEFSGLSDDDQVMLAGIALRAHAHAVRAGGAPGASPAAPRLSSAGGMRGWHSPNQGPRSPSGGGRPHAPSAAA